MNWKGKYYQYRKYLFDPLAWYLSKRELHQWMTRNTNKEIIQATQEYVGRGHYASIHAVQRISEIMRLTEIVQQLRPKIIAEIGTHKGGSLYIWCRSNPTADLVVSLDLPGGQYGGGYSKTRIKLYREFLFDRPQTQIVFMRCDSHTKASYDELCSYLHERPIDFLYIDGDHSYEGVKQDFTMYAPLVRPGGIVAFHDIVTRDKDHQVYRFWDEVKHTYQYEEIIENASSRMGIGVLHIN